MPNDDTALIVLVAGVAAGVLLSAAALFVWYALALSRLFPRLGGEGWKGWVPVLNEAEILIRGSVPGWSVVFFFIPLVQFYGLYLKIVAVHRINVRFRHGVGFTTLGILVPPLWATLLARADEPVPEEARQRNATVRTLVDPRRAEPARDASGYAIPIPASLEPTLIDEVPIDRASTSAWQIALDDGTRLVLTAPRVVLGRSPAGDPDEQLLSVPDASRTLSKTHARLEHDGAAWHLSDLNSTNGSRIAVAGGWSDVTPGILVPLSGPFQLGDVGLRIEPFG